MYKQLGLGEYKQKKRKREECSICLDGADLLVLVPCGHKCVCATCRARIKQCPICRKTIESTVQRVY